MADCSYILLLRGINVGGNKKVPMPELKALLEKQGLNEVKTILNTGNALFKGKEQEVEALENQLENSLEKHFGFNIPCILRRKEDIESLVAADPFKGIDVVKTTRLYISFLKKDVQSRLTLPYSSADSSFRILLKDGRTIASVLELAYAKTPDAMKILEQEFGKGITTRNWNTVQKLISD